MKLYRDMKDLLASLGEQITETDIDLGALVGTRTRANVVSNGRVYQVDNITPWATRRCEEAERINADRARRLAAIGCHSGSHAAAVQAGALAVLATVGLVPTDPTDTPPNTPERSREMSIAHLLMADFGHALPEGFDASPHSAGPCLVITFNDRRREFILGHFTRGPS